MTEKNEIQLQPGMCAGFTPDGVAHYLLNRTTSDVMYLEVGDRIVGDRVSYPQDDLVAKFGEDGKWQFTHKDGNNY